MWLCVQHLPSLLTTLLTTLLKTPGGKHRLNVTMDGGDVASVSGGDRPSEWGRCRPSRGAFLETKVPAEVIVEDLIRSSKLGVRKMHWQNNSLHMYSGIFTAPATMHVGSSPHLCHGGICASPRSRGARERLVQCSGHSMRGARGCLLSIIVMPPS